MAVNISEEEVQQLLRTVEMFEAITDAQPDDYQSLEILKEAHNKLGHEAQALAVSRKLATAYQKMGHVSEAILECEGILQKHPDDAGTQAILASLQNSAGMAATTPPAGSPKNAAPAVESPNPMSVATVRRRAEEGDKVLANFLIAEKLATPQALDPLIEKLKTLRLAVPDRNLPLSLVHLMVQEQIAKMEDLLTVLLDKSNLAYVPLSQYDLDRDTACLLPLEFSWQLCLVPFDSISRSVLVATVNPFDQATHQQVERILNKKTFWYISPPGDIIGALRRAHGLDTGKAEQGAAK